MKKNVNRIRKAAKGAAAGPGRVAQRNRTRKAIVDATIQLLGGGATPSASEIAEAAQVSRRTLYMHFPTLEQLLLDATVGALTQNTVEPALTDSASKDPIERVVQLSRAMNNQSADTLKMGRSLIRLTVEGQPPAAGGPRRGHRRVEWIERALAPAREQLWLSPKEFERLVSALCVLIGWEPLIVLQDVRCLDAKQTNEVLAFAIRAVLEKALNEAKSKAHKK